MPEKKSHQGKIRSALFINGTDAEALRQARRLSLANRIEDAVELGFLKNLEKSVIKKIGNAVADIGGDTIGRVGQETKNLLTGKGFKPDAKKQTNETWIESTGGLLGVNKATEKVKGVKDSALLGVKKAAEIAQAKDKQDKNKKAIDKASGLLGVKNATDKITEDQTRSIVGDKPGLLGVNWKESQHPRGDNGRFIRGSSRRAL